MIDERLLSTMTPITLEEMDGIRLMNRVDTKYLTDEETLAGVLEELSGEGFLVFETEGQRLCRYNSLYFDTPEYRMYLDHHNRHLTRQKVRTRRYEANGETYLEIKRKNNHGRTKKKRTGIAPELFDSFSGSSELTGWFEQYSTFGATALSPSVTTNFRRITLVDPSRSERITVDTEIRFTNRRNGNESGLGKAVVIEIKQDGLKRSRMREILLEHRVKPYRISKYCMGVVLTEPDVKRNRFLPKVRTIEKINRKTSI